LKKDWWWDGKCGIYLNAVVGCLWPFAFSPIRWLDWNCGNDLNSAI